MTRSNITRPGRFALGLGLTLACGCVALGGDDDDSEPAGGTTMEGGATGEPDDDGPGSSGDGDDDDETGDETGDDDDDGSDESEGSGGDDLPPTDDGPGPGPSQDPMPDADAAGEYVCDGCPAAMTDLDDLTGQTESTYAIAGTSVGHEGHGQFIVVAEDGRYAGGMLPIDDASGSFAQAVPLFCGENLVKILLSNASGTSAYVRRVEHTECQRADVRITVAWDETTQEWGTHLVRFGGTIGDDDTDCQNRFFCSGDLPDWGVMGNDLDNPVQDLDVYGEPMGVENIRYSGAEDGLTLLVENIDLDGGLAPAGTVYVNVGSFPTRVMQIEALPPYAVLTVADIDGQEGSFSWIDEEYDCAAEWDSDHCAADLP
jgi:hypothetical protein